MRTHIALAGGLAATSCALAAPAAATAPATAPACAPIHGVEPLLEPGAVVLVGELHGTNESPAFVSAMACHALDAAFAVTVALEWPADEADRIDAFLASAGSATDRAELLDGALWQAETQDGRTSVAMFGLLDDIRSRRVDGSSVDVALLDEATGSGDRDRWMAEHLAAAAAANPNGLLLALTGNVHTMVAPGPGANPEFEPMGQIATELLGDRALVALDGTFDGGTAWLCTATCGETVLDGSGPADRGFAVTLHANDTTTGYHGEYSVGPISASPPAAES